MIQAKPIFLCVCLKVAYFSSRGKYLLLCVSLKYIDIFE